MNMHERIASGKLFTDMCEGLPQERDDARRKMISFNNTTPDNIEERKRIQRDMLHENSGSVCIEPPFYFCYGKHIILGEGTFINFNCTFIDDGIITVGKNVLFGAAVTIATVGHPIRPDMREYMYTDPVTIKDNVWIGNSVTICPGVTIGENSVIGAGSVVVKDIPANSVAAGNPCKVIREISDRDMEYYYRDRKINQLDLNDEKDLRALESTDEADEFAFDASDINPFKPFTSVETVEEKKEAPAEKLPEVSTVSKPPVTFTSIKADETPKAAEETPAFKTFSSVNTEEKPKESVEVNAFKPLNTVNAVEEAPKEPAEVNPFKPLVAEKETIEAPKETIDASPFKPLGMAKPAEEKSDSTPFKSIASEKPANEPRKEMDNPFKNFGLSKADAGLQGGKSGSSHLGLGLSDSGSGETLGGGSLGGSLGGGSLGGGSFGESLGGSLGGETLGGGSLGGGSGKLGSYLSDNSGSSGETLPQRSGSSNHFYPINSSNNGSASQHEPSHSPFKKNAASKESEEKSPLGGSNPSPFKPLNTTNSDVPSPFGTPLGGSPFKPLNQ